MGNAIVIKVPSRRSRILAMRSPMDTEVVAHGNDLDKVLEKAAKAGVKDPIIMFVPRPGRRHTY
ncbi:MAG: DUF5678 domain-containing protein [Phycisphaerae bacterium]